MRKRGGCWCSPSLKSWESTPSGRGGGGRAWRGLDFITRKCVNDVMEQNILSPGPLMRYRVDVRIRMVRQFLQSCVLIDTSDGKGQAASLLTLKGDFTLSGASAEDMTELITMFLCGLRERSRFAVTLKEVETQGRSSGLGFCDCAEPQLRHFLVLFYVTCSLSCPPHLHR